MSKIVTLRNKIDDIDNEIIALLDSRFELSKEIGKEKAKENIAITDQNREKEILAKTEKAKNKDAIKTTYKTIFEQSKKIQK